MAKFEVKTPRTPEGAERRMQRTFNDAIGFYQDSMHLDEKGHVFSNTINDKDLGVKISLVPCYDNDGYAMEDLALLDVEEYSTSSDQRHELPTAKTTYLFDSQGNICEVCYSDSRKFDEYENPFYEIYDDKGLQKNIAEKFEEVNTPINASLLDSLALSNSLYVYDTKVIKNDIENIAYPTLLKTYIHQRLDKYVDPEEITDSIDGFDVKDLYEISDKVSELDEDKIEKMIDQIEQENDDENELG